MEKKWREIGIFPNKLDAESALRFFERTQEKDGYERFAIAYGRKNKKDKNPYSIYGLR